MNRLATVFIFSLKAGKSKKCPSNKQIKLKIKILRDTRLKRIRICVFITPFHIKVYTTEKSTAYKCILFNNMVTD